MPPKGAIRVAQGRQLPNIEGVEGFDDLDLKLVGHVRDNEEWTYKSAAEFAGCAVATAWARITRIRRSDFITAMREDLERLGSKMADAIAAGLDDAAESRRANVAMRVLDGLGVTVARQEQITRAAPVTGDDIVDAFKRLPTLEQERTLSAIGGASETAGQSDA